jgi:hypothetical protein
MKRAKTILLSRRDFLKLSGIASLSIALSACKKISTPEPSPKFAVSPTSTPIDTPTATNAAFFTATSKPSPTSTPHRSNFRDITESTGTYVCATVSGDENWLSTPYEKAEKGYFSGIFVQNSFTRDVVARWTDLMAREFTLRDRAKITSDSFHRGLMV